MPGSRPGHVWRPAEQAFRSLGLVANPCARESKCNCGQQMTGSLLLTLRKLNTFGNPMVLMGM